MSVVIEDKCLHENSLYRCHNTTAASVSVCLHDWVSEEERFDFPHLGNLLILSIEEASGESLTSLRILNVVLMYEPEDKKDCVSY